MDSCVVIRVDKKVYGLAEINIFTSAYDDSDTADRIFDSINKKFTDNPDYNSIIDGDDHKHYNKDMTKPSYFVKKYIINKNGSLNDLLDIL